MDALPPNDPNRNSPNNNNAGSPPKTVEVTRAQQRRTSSTNRPRLNERGEMDVFLGGGNLGDDVMIAVLVFVGAAAWILREVCVCR